MNRITGWWLLIGISMSIPSIAQIDNVGSGRTIHFDGTDDYVDLGNIYDDLSFPFTLSAWINVDPSNTVVRPIFASQDDDQLYNGFWFFVHPSIMYFECGDGRGDINPSFRQGRQANIPNISGKWNHVAAVVRSENDMDLYLNGVSLNTMPTNGTSSFPINSNSALGRASIGRHKSGGVTHFFKGGMDEVRLFNIALTETEIRTQMCIAINGNENGLIGYWNFNETSGNTILDNSSKSFHGELQGTPIRTFSGAPIGTESVHVYSSSWTSVIPTMINGNDEITVKDIQGAPAGVHIYKVNSLPSQTDGIDLTKVSQPYLGVFTANVNFSAAKTFDVTYKSGTVLCELYTRSDNSKSAWSISSLENTIERAEFLKFNVAEPFEVNIGQDQILCDQSDFMLSINLDPTDKTILWSTGQTSPSIVITEGGTYSVSVSKDCQQSTDEVIILFLQTPQAFSLGNDLELCSFKPFELIPTDKPNGLSFIWQDGSDKSTYEVKEFGTYWSTIKNACGEASDTIKIEKKTLTDYSIPNVITPDNGDNLNQTFQIHPKLLGSTLSIFNRWGDEVYSSSNYLNNWSGTDLPVGTYYYSLHSDCLGEFKGWIAIIR